MASENFRKARNSTARRPPVRSSLRITIRFDVGGFVMRHLLATRLLVSDSLSISITQTPQRSSKFTQTRRFSPGRLFRPKALLLAARGYAATLGSVRHAEPPEPQRGSATGRRFADDVAPSGQCMVNGYVASQGSFATLGFVTQRLRRTRGPLLAAQENSSNAMCQSTASRSRFQRPSACSNSFQFVYSPSAIQGRSCQQSRPSCFDYAV